VFASWTNSFSSLLCIILISYVLKNRLSNVTRVLGLMVLIGAVGALGLSALPNAAAMSPSVTFLPPVPVVGPGNPTIVLTAGIDGTTPTLDVRVGLVEPLSTGIIITGPTAPTFGAFPPGGGDCGLQAYSSGGGSYWIFEDGVGGQVMFDMMSAGDTVSILFAPNVINPMYTGTASGPATGVWVDQNLVANKVPSIDFLTDQMAFPAEVYLFLNCGFDTGVNGIATLNILYNDQKQMITQEPTAGEIIPIDATALVLGGITTPSMMLPLLAIAAGGAFVYLRFQVLRKD